MTAGGQGGTAAREALATSDARLRAMAEADHTPAMFWLTDADGLRVYLSDDWYAFTGQTPATGLGLGWLEATHPGDREAAADIFAAALKRREPFRITYRLRRRDGEYRWAIDAAAPRYAPDGDFAGYVGSVIDITGRKLADEAVRESEARIRAVFSSIDEGFCLCEMVLDDEGRAVDYRFLEANPLFEDMSGLQDPVGRTARELVPGIEERWIETYAKVAFGTEPLRFESGSEAMGRFFDVFATPVAPRGRFVVVFSDVTERRRAQDALVAREAAERRARQQAELLAEIIAGIEAVDGFEARADRLVELLVPRVADAARIELPARGGTAASVLPAAPQLSPSHCAVPLDAGGDVRAALLLERHDPEGRSFTEEDLAFIRRVADNVGVVFARTLISEEEHRIALRLQQALLPDEVLRHPGVELAARYLAAAGVLEVGGDWYDSFVLPDGRVELVAGDVVGHGLEAAAAMGRLRTALAALAPLSTGPGRLLELLDAFAVGPNSADFATACCATLDTATGELRYASAGHPPMLVVPAAGEAWWLEGGRSAALHGRPVGARPEASVVLDRGDVVVLYSDGLVERRRESPDAGLARLRDVAVAARGLPVEELCDRILAGLGVDAARDDDVVVLCARRSA